MDSRVLIPKFSQMKKDNRGCTVIRNVRKTFKEMKNITGSTVKHHILEWSRGKEAITVQGIL
jgi:predicted small secreted protein